VVLICHSEFGTGTALWRPCRAERLLLLPRVLRALPRGLLAPHLCATSPKPSAAFRRGRPSQCSLILPLARRSLSLSRPPWPMSEVLAPPCLPASLLCWASQERPPPQALGGAETHRVLAIAEAAAAGSAILKLLSCCAAAACCLASQGQAQQRLDAAKPQCGLSLPPSAASPLVELALLQSRGI